MTSPTQIVIESMQIMQKVRLYFLLVICYCVNFNSLKLICLKFSVLNVKNLVLQLVQY